MTMMTIMTIMTQVKWGNNLLIIHLKIFGLFIAPLMVMVKWYVSDFAYEILIL